MPRLRSKSLIRLGLLCVIGLVVYLNTLTSSNKPYDEPIINATKLKVELHKDLSFLSSHLSQIDANLVIQFDSDAKSLVSNKRLINKNASKHRFLIVEYTKVFGSPKFCHMSSEAIFNSAIEKCEYTNCEYSCDRQSAKIATADALIFHQRDLEEELAATYDNQVSNWLQKTKQLPFNTSQLKLANNPDQVN